MVFGAESLVRQKHHDLSGKIFYYDVTNKRWDTVMMSLETLNTRAFTAVSSQNEIFLTGGIKNEKVSDEVRAFYTYLNKWKQLNPLIQGRYHHSCIFEENRLYAIGDYDVTKYLLISVARRNRWILLFKFNGMLQSIKRFMEVAPEYATRG